jgi:hypothetical protein
MSVFAAAGTLNVSTAAAGNTVVVSGLLDGQSGQSFTPVCVLFSWTGRTAVGSGRASHRRGFGVAVTTTSRWAVASRSADAEAVGNADSAHVEDACIVTQGGGGAVDGAMDLQSLDNGGFTLVIDDAFPSDFLVHFLALGGDTLAARAGRFTAAGPAPTTQAVTVETDFQPTGVLFATAHIAADPPGNQADSRLGLGAMSASDQEGAWVGGANDTPGTMQTASYCLAGECIGTLNASLNAVANRAEFSAFGVNGFTVNWLERNDTARIFYLALKGASIFVGNFLTQTDTVTTIVESGFGFKPAALMVVSHGKAQSTADTFQDHDLLSVGFAASVSNRGSGAVHDEDNVADSEVTTADTTTAVYQNIDTTNAVVALGDIQSFDIDGFTGIMPDADPSQAFVWYVAFGPAAAAGSGIAGPLIGGKLAGHRGPLIGGRLVA